jgi:hypothetical protein
MTPTDKTVRFRRGDTSPDRPGMIFYQRKNGREYWVTPEQFQKNAEFFKTYAPNYYRANREKVLNYHRKWLRKPGSLEKKKQAYNNWVEKLEGRIVRREVSKRHRDTINGTIVNRVRSRIAVALRQGYTKSASTLSLIGCSIPEFKNHLESQFQDGMSWENFSEWEIDHRVPLSAFNLADPHQQKLAFNFENCQPMWKRSNREESDRVEGELFRGRDFREAKIIPFKAA